jgi:hypothetical protein
MSKKHKYKTKINACPTYNPENTGHFPGHLIVRSEEQYQQECNSNNYKYGKAYWHKQSLYYVYFYPNGVPDISRRFVVQKVPNYGSRNNKQEQ